MSSVATPPLIAASGTLLSTEACIMENHNEFTTTCNVNSVAFAESKESINSNNNNTDTNNSLENTDEPDCNGSDNAVNVHPSGSSDESEAVTTNSSDSAFIANNNSSNVINADKEFCSTSENNFVPSESTITTQLENVNINAEDFQPHQDIQCLASNSAENVEVQPLATPESTSGTRKSSANSEVNENNNGDNQRTQELIKKQINEIEKEISRRIQNKNVKKIDEAELAQLLSDHGFGSFVSTNTNNESSVNNSQQTSESGLPYKPLESSDIFLHQNKSSLSQLSSSFSPPSSESQLNPILNPSCDTFGNFLPQQQFYFQQNSPAQHFHTENFTSVYAQPQTGNPPQNFGMTLPNGMHGPATFLTSPIMPQHHQPMMGFMPQQQQGQSPSVSSCVTSPSLSQPPQQFVHGSFQVGNGTSTTSAMNMTNNTFNSQQPFLNQVPFYPFHQSQSFYQPQQPQVLQNTSVPSPPLPFATVLSPILSNITPEMAAALLQQIQQENPSLIENLVSQSKNKPADTLTKSDKPAAVLPAPPQPLNGVSRPVKTNSLHSNSDSKKSPTSLTTGNQSEENGWNELSKRHSTDGSLNGGLESKENGAEPIWVMRESYLKRLKREEQRNRELMEEVASTSAQNGSDLVSDKSSVSLEIYMELCTSNHYLDPLTNLVNETNGSTTASAVDVNGDEIKETDKLLSHVDNGENNNTGTCDNILDDSKNASKKSSTSNNKKEVMVHEPAVLIEGVLFRARYLGSTQLTTDGRPTKTSRMSQAQEAVARVKAPDGEIQPSTEIDLFISTEKIMVLNTDLQRISETDVRQDILMDHALRSISYIADIGDLVVLMARRVPQPNDSPINDENSFDHISGNAPRVVCHVFESEEASFIAQSIGQAFQVAYVEFLRANGIDDPAYLREIDYQEVLNSQELMGEELEMFARKETQKDVVVPKKVGEPLGIVVVESGWGSILPTVVVANMAPGGPASRSNQLNIGDQIIAINGISLVGLPLATAQQNIKNAKTSTAVRLTIVSTPPVVEVRIKRPDTKYQLGFSVQNGVICSLLRGGIAERGGIRVGHRIIEINQQSVVAVPHERIVNMLATATGEIHMRTMPTSMFRLLTGQEVPNYI